MADGTLVREWNIGTDLSITTDTDKGIESLAFDPSDGVFYAGIQGLAKVYAFTLDPACAAGSCTATAETRISGGSFTVANGHAPSGLFYHNETRHLWVLCGTSTNGDQYLYKYSSTVASGAASLSCSVTIPQSSTKFSRTDGFFIDGSFAYIADSQGPMHVASGSLGHNLYQVAWTSDPCTSSSSSSTTGTTTSTTTGTTTSTTTATTTGTTTGSSIDAAPLSAIIAPSTAVIAAIAAATIFAGLF